MIKAEIGELACLTEARVVVRFDEDLVDRRLMLILLLIHSELSDARRSSTKLLEELRDPINFIIELRVFLFLFLQRDLLI